MKRNRKEYNFNDFSKQEKEKLKTVRQELIQAQKEEPESLREHLQAFNDGVMAIIITIIVLEIQPAINEVHYGQFLANIIVFLILMGTRLGLILTEKNKVPSNTAIAKI